MYLELKKTNGDKWPDPHPRLWARYKVNGFHTDLDNPPAVSPFTGFVPKRAKQESLSETLTSAATAFVQAFGGSSALQKMCPQLLLLHLIYPLSRLLTNG